MAKRKESPSQTAGPYVHIGCVPQTAGLEQRGMGTQLGRRAAAGQQIRLELSVLDGANDPVNDALVEIWQQGAQSHWARQATDLETGYAVFETVKPEATQTQAPHILVWIVARGINLGLTTRIYFPDANNADDPVLSLTGDRAGSLIAAKTDNGYAHVIRLQGPHETVFFDV